jgi:hypothetical protein
MKAYFIIESGERKGPFTFEQLKGASITRETFVWHEELSDWTQAQNLPELKERFVTPPPFKGNQAPPPPVEPLPPSYAMPLEDAPRRKIPFIPIGLGAIVVITLAFLFINSQRETALVQSQITEMQDEQLHKEDEKKRALEELTTKNRNYRNNWTSYYQARHGSFTLGFLGGIRDLSVIFTNNTEYMADEMVATVTYIKANGEVWDRVQVTATNVPAHSEKTVAVPDMQRGTSVEVEIKSISSKKLHFYFGAEYNSGNPEDPYFSK